MSNPEIPQEDLDFYNDQSPILNALFDPGTSNVSDYFNNVWPLTLGVIDTIRSKISENQWLLVLNLAINNTEAFDMLEEDLFPGITAHTVATLIAIGYEVNDDMVIDNLAPIVTNTLNKTGHLKQKISDSPFLYKQAIIMVNGLMKTGNRFISEPEAQDRMEVFDNFLDHERFDPD